MKSQYFIFTTNNQDPPDLKTIKRLKKPVLVIAGIFALCRDLIIYAITNREYYWEDGYATYNWKETYIHSFFEFLMTIILYLILERFYLLVYPKTPNKREIVSHDIFMVAQLSILKDAMTLIFVGVRALSYPIFTTSISWQSGYFEPSDIYWNLFFVYVVLTVLYFTKNVIENLKPGYRDFNKLIFASFVISNIVFWIGWGLVWLIRLLISLPFGYEFYS